MSQSDAIREIRAQTADWNAYRQKLPARGNQKADPGGPTNSNRQDQQFGCRQGADCHESAKEVLKLSKGEAPGDGTVAVTGGKIESAQDKKNAEQEDAIAVSKALKEDQARTAMLENNLKDMQRLAELKSGAAALASTIKMAAPCGRCRKLVVPQATAQEPKPKPKLVEPEPLMDPGYGCGSRFWVNRFIWLAVHYSCLATLGVSC